MAIYIKNAAGGIHSVDEEHFDKYLSVVAEDGKRYPLPGVTVIDEQAAKAEHPQLFGAPDLNIEAQKTARAIADESLQEEHIAKQAAKVAAAKAAPKQAAKVAAPTTAE